MLSMVLKHKSAPAFDQTSRVLLELSLRFSDGAENVLKATDDEHVGNTAINPVHSPFCVCCASLFLTSVKNTSSSVSAPRTSSALVDGAVTSTCRHRNQFILKRPLTFVPKKFPCGVK